MLGAALWPSLLTLCVYCYRQIRSLLEYPSASSYVVSIDHSPSQILNVLADLIFVIVTQQTIHCRRTAAHYEQFVDLAPSEIVESEVLALVGFGFWLIQSSVLIFSTLPYLSCFDSTYPPVHIIQQLHNSKQESRGPVSPR